MKLPDYIEANKDRLIDRWKQLTVERLALELEVSELLNDLPSFVDDLVTTLRNPGERWPAIASAEGHGRHRMRSGIDMGALTEEMALIVEALSELGEEDGRYLSAGEMRQIARVIGRGTAASVNAYAAMRDAQLGKQAAEHFSFVAHELRTPLQSARMAATLLAAEAGENRSKHLDRLERSLARLTDLVDNSLLQVRLSGTPDMNVERWRGEELVEAACDIVRDHAEARGQRIDMDIQSFEIDADRKLLVSALTNLLKNAVKFTHDGGSISVRASARDSRALFEIEDECGGLPDDLPAKLFQPFTQAHADKSGFGLGLMIVKQAAEAHHGSVRVINRPGECCTFVLDLPLLEPTSSESPEDHDGG